MIGDCLLPVYTKEGPATLVTCNQREVLTEGMKFETLNSYVKLMNDYRFYSVNVRDSSDYDNKKVARLILCHDVKLKVQDGWKTVEEISDYVKNANLLDINVKGLSTRCIVCDNLYFCNKPIWSTCSMKCQKLAIKNKMYNYELITGNNICVAKKESWVKVVAIVKMRPVFKTYQCVGVKNKSIYVRDLLVSGENNEF